jgi:hypothetical protein
MITVYIWGATGTDPRYPQGIRLYFGYPATELQVMLTLQHFLGYSIYLTDKFPLIENLRKAELQEESDTGELQYVLSDDLRIQMPKFTESTLPAGTRVLASREHELLYDSVD